MRGRRAVRQRARNYSSQLCFLDLWVQNIPESVEGTTPHLQVLRLVPIPEIGEVGLVPDINDQAVGHAVGLDVAEEMG